MPDALEDWNAFRAAVLGDPYSVWEGGPDFSGLTQRWTTDPLFVERVLIDGLTGGDPLAADAMAALPWAPDAHTRVVDALETRVGTQPVTLHLHATLALRTLTADPAWDHQVTRVASGAGFWGDRLEAVVAMARLPASDATITALSAAVADPDSLVRRQAACVLLRMAAEAGSDLDHRAILRSLRVDSPPQGWSVTASALADAARFIHA